MESRGRRTRRNRRKGQATLVFSFVGLILLAAGLILWIKPFEKQENTGTKKIASTSLSEPVSRVENSSSSQTQPQWLQTKNDNQLPIMMYHYIAPNPPDGNTIPPDVFESDLVALKDNGYYTVNSKEAYRVLSSHEIPSTKIIWLTFDDGADNLYTQVFPLLKKYNFHATSFIITGAVGKPGYVTEDQIREMSASGLIDFQSHTVDHIDLNQASDPDQIHQLQASKEYLDNLLGVNQTFVLCYPSGSHNSRTADLGTNLGYKMGLLDPGRTYDGETARNAPADPSLGLFKLNRFRTFSNTNGTSLLSMVAGATDYNSQNINQ